MNFHILFFLNDPSPQVCAEALNSTLDSEQVETLVQSLANTTCQHLQYNQMTWAAVTRDTEEETSVQYVGVSYTLLQGLEPS